SFRCAMTDSPFPNSSMLFCTIVGDSRRMRRQPHDRLSFPNAYTRAGRCEGRTADSREACASHSVIAASARRLKLYTIVLRQRNAWGLTPHFLFLRPRAVPRTETTLDHLCLVVA